MSTRKTQLSLAVRYACLLIGQQWRVDNAALYAKVSDRARMRSLFSGTTTGRINSSEPAKANVPQEGRKVDGTGYSTQGDYTRLKRIAGA